MSGGDMQCFFRMFMDVPQTSPISCHGSLEECATCEPTIHVCVNYPTLPNWVYIKHFSISLRGHVFISMPLCDHSPSSFAQSFTLEALMAHHNGTCSSQLWPHHTFTTP